jgi:hypothetical protein
MKVVKFSDIVDVQIIPNKKYEPRSIKMYFINQYQNRIDVAHIKIMNLLNQYSTHKIIKFDDEIPLKIYSPSKQWYEDNSAILIINSLEKSKCLLSYFVKEFNIMINKYISQNTSGHLEYKTNLYKENMMIKINALTRNDI